MTMELAWDAWCISQGCVVPTEEARKGFKYAWNQAYNLACNDMRKELDRQTRRLAHESVQLKIEDVPAAGWKLS